MRSNQEELDALPHDPVAEVNLGANLGWRSSLLQKPVERTFGTPPLKLRERHVKLEASRSTS